MTKDPGSITLNVRVIPRSSKSEIVGLYNGDLKVKLKSPPVEGAANEELIKLLSKEFGRPRSDIEMLAGQTSKRKRLRIRGIDTAQFNAILKVKI